MIQPILLEARAASRALLECTAPQIDDVLRHLADALLAAAPAILEANAHDVSRMEASDPRVDRLLLNASRLEGMAQDTRAVADLPSPLNKELSRTVRPNGMVIRKVSVPFLSLIHI